MQGNFLRGATYRMFENFFDMPAMMLCARLIDIVDKEVSATQGTVEPLSTIQNLN